MDFIESLGMYTQAQRMVAYSFVACSGLLLTGGFLTFLFPSAGSLLCQGFKIGCFIFGLLILAGGIGYLQFNEKNHSEIESRYQADSENEMKSENVRMQKVVADFKVFQYVFAGIVILALVVIVFARPFWIGFAFPAAFLHVAVLLIEAHSKASINQHAEIVSTLINRLSK